MAQPQPKVPHQNSNLQPSRSQHIGQTGSGLEGLDRHLSPEHGAGSPDIATEVNVHVTPDELFGPMSPRRGHGYSDNTINSKKHGDNGDVFRNTDQELPSPINIPETVTSSSKMETATKEGVVQDSPYTDQSAETDYGRSRSNQSKDSPARFKVSSMTVNRENVNKIRSRLHRDQNSPNGLSSRSSYLHVNIFDDNLNISDSKLDNTLLRLFSRNSNVIGNYLQFDNPMESHNFSHSDFIGLEPVMWRVYPMMAAHKETLDREMDFIAFHVKPREIIGRLYKDGILTSLDYNQLARTAAQGDRAVTRLLIRTLQRRGAKAYPALINALLASDYYLVCERLSESEHELKTGTLTDRAETDWRNMKGGMHATPNRFYTPYMGTSADYAVSWPVFPSRTLFSSNQNFPANETWPQASQKSLIDHMSPLYHTMPANHTVTPEGRDSLTLGTLRLEHRLNDVDRSLKTIHQDIASLRTDSRTQRDTLAMQREPQAYSSDRSPLRQSVGLGHQELLHGHLQQQMNDLKVKMKTVHEDIATLKGRNSVRDFPLLDQSLAGYHYRNLGETTDGRRIIDAEMLDGHLGALRSEIKMLHDDVTALKTARSFSVQIDRSPHSTSRSFGKSSSRPHVDDSYLSPTRQSRAGDSSRDKSGSYSNIIPGPLPHALLPRYPSRYSPQFVHTGQYPDTSRSESRADSVTRSSRSKTTTDGSKSVPQRGDTSFNKSRNPDKKIQNTHYQETDDRPHFQEDDMFTNSKDDSQIRFNKTCDDDRLFPDNYSSDRNMKTKEPVDKDVLLTSRSHDVLSPAESKDNILDKDNSNDTHTDKNEDNIFQDIDEDSKFDNANYDEDNGRHGSKSRLDNRDSGMFNQGKSLRQPHDNSSKAMPRTGSDNILPLTKDARYTDERAVTSRVPTSGDRERRDHPYPNRVPEIVIPQKSPQPVSDPGSRNEVSSNASYSNQQPKQKKKVRYSDTPTMDYNHKIRDNNERPKSRATNPTYNRAATKSPATSRDGKTSTSRRLASPADDQSSDDDEYVPLTTPTRILSPPHGLPFERVTTPYKILRNPNNRKMTTWSKKQARLRNTNRKGKI